MKTNLKVLLIVTALFAMAAFSNVFAVEYSFKDEVFDLIPESMQLDIKESEYKDAYDAIKANLLAIFEKDGITSKEEIGEYGEKTIILTKGEDTATISIFTPNIYESTEYFYQAEVAILDYDRDENYKIITLAYSNKATDADKEYVKSIELGDNDYVEVNADKYFSMDNVEFCEEYANEYYTQLINDSSVKALTELYYYDGSDINTRVNSIRVAIFKDDALTDIRTVKLGVTIPVIEVPSDIQEDNYPEYIKSKMMKYNKDFANGVKKIEKGNASENGILLSAKFEVPDMYTLLNDNNNGDGYVIARKAKVEKVERILPDINVVLESDTEVVPKEVKIEAVVLDEKNSNLAIIQKSLDGIASKAYCYEIDLVSEGKKIQPNGKVTIKLPIPEGFDKTKLAVYRIAEDGTKTEYEVKIVEDMIVFETDHFSTYVIVEKVETKSAEAETSSSAVTTKPADYRPNPDTGCIYREIINTNISSVTEILK